MTSKKTTDHAHATEWAQEVASRRANKAAIDRAFDIALRIMDLMDEKGWKAADLATAIGKTPQYVSRLRKGQELNIGQQLLLKLEAALGAPITSVVSAAETSMPTPTATLSLATVHAGIIYQQHYRYPDGGQSLMPGSKAADTHKKTGSTTHTPFLMSHTHA